MQKAQIGISISTMFLLNKNVNYLIIFSSIFLLDRISKILVINKTKEIQDNSIFISKFVNFDLVWNEGIAFGLLSFSDSSFYHVVTMVIGAVIIVIFIMFLKANKIEKIFYLIIFSGATSNFYDRVVFQSVPDFIDIHIKNQHWFIFNVADIFISISIVGLILNEILIKNK
jgi:signal peptidase II